MIIENDKITIQLKEGIVFIKYKPGSVIDLETAKFIVKSRLLLIQGKEHCTFTDISDMKSVTSEARAYFNTEESYSLTPAAAIYTTSKYTKFIADFFMKFHKPKIIAQVFTDETKALVWLQQFKTS